jgi:hypothetical protein
MQPPANAENEYHDARETFSVTEGGEQGQDSLKPFAGRCHVLQSLHAGLQQAIISCRCRISSACLSCISSAAVTVMHFRSFRVAACQVVTAHPPSWCSAALRAEKSMSACMQMDHLSAPPLRHPEQQM